MQSPAIKPPDSAADKWFSENPYILPVRCGLVRKTELFRIVGMSADRFRKEVRTLCDSDPKFDNEYKPFREMRSISITVAEIIVKSIVDNPYCTVQFERSTAR